jgi:hypothetical protein
MTTALETLCARKRIAIDAHYGGVELPDGFDRGSHPWKVTLKYGRRRLTVPFFQGSAHTHEPTAADVLYCLCLDASSVDTTSGFEDWCRDLGYDTDSRRAEKTYRACERIAVRLHAFLGDDFNTFCEAEH